jgi:hypothetical protein
MEPSTTAITSALPWAEEFPRNDGVQRAVSSTPREGCGSRSLSEWTLLAGVHEFFAIEDAVTDDVESSIRTFVEVPK